MCTQPCLLDPHTSFALARFLIGTTAFTFSLPPLNLRIGLCLGALDKLQVSHSFSTDIPLLGIPQQQWTEVSTPIARPYDANEHATATGTVLGELVQGRAPEASPSALLNALWHAVGNRGPHVNELALARALGRSSDAYPD
jgi:hypothetical protein